MRIMTLLLPLALAGCAAFPSQFDANEHARIVNIHVISIDDTVCTDRARAATASQGMYTDARWVYHYGRLLPDNDAMSKMEIELLTMTKELADRYEKADPVSVFYCRAKFENIKKATDVMIKVSARRPR